MASEQGAVIHWDEISTPSVLGIDYDSIDWEQSLSTAAWAADGGMIGAYFGGPVGAAIGIGIGGGAGYLVDQYGSSDDPEMVAELTRTVAVDAGNATEGRLLAIYAADPQGKTQAEAEREAAEAREQTEQAVWNFSAYLASQRGSAWSAAVAGAANFYSRIQGAADSMVSFLRRLAERTSRTATTQQAAESSAIAGPTTPLPGATPDWGRKPAPPAPPAPPVKAKGPPWGLWIAGLIILVMVSLVVMKVRKKR